MFQTTRNIMYEMVGKSLRKESQHVRLCPSRFIYKLITLVCDIYVTPFDWFTILVIGFDKNTRCH